LGVGKIGFSLKRRSRPFQQSRQFCLIFRREKLGHFSSITCFLKTPIFFEKLQTSFWKTY
jgi:hypothetical protein